MAFFGLGNKGKDSLLEQAINGLISLPEFGIGLSLSEGKERKETPVYLLPIDFEIYNNPYSSLLRSLSGNNTGLFIQNNVAVNIPIGFVRETSFLEKVLGDVLSPYYHFIAKEMIGTPLRERQTLYLPLELTDLWTELASKDIYGQFKRNSHSPFQLYGIKGIPERYPLVLVQNTGTDLEFFGLYRNELKKVATYSIKPSAERKKLLLDFLEPHMKQRSKVASREEAAVKPAGDKRNTKAEKTQGKIKAESDVDLEDPKSIVRYLDKYVIGQEEAKKVVAVAFSNYHTRMRSKDDRLGKDNAMLIGPTGSGKTYMISLLAKKAGLPMVETKLTGKSSEGYKGENLSDIFHQLSAQTRKEAPYGVVFLDEIDKLASGAASGFGERLQDELIGWLEEAVVTIGSDYHQGKSRLNTKNLLFVTAGAFQGRGDSPGLEEIIQKRTGRQRKIGFGQEREESGEHTLLKIKPEDLVEYGLKTELVGRLPAIAIFNALTHEDKIKILKEAGESPFARYAALLELKGYRLEVEGAVHQTIAEHCPQETGARALKAICNNLFTKIMYAPEEYANQEKVVVVTSSLAKKLIDLYGSEK